MASYVVKFMPGTSFETNVTIDYTTSTSNGVFTFTLTKVSWKLVATTGSIQGVGIDDIKVSFNSQLLCSTGSVIADRTGGWHTYSVSKTVNQTTSAQTKQLTVQLGQNPSTSTNITVPALASYSVTYNANGGTGTTASQTKYYGHNLTLRANGFTRTGYSFYHWNTKSDNSGTTYNASATYTGNAALSLYAIWNPIISFNANGGSGAPSNQTKTFNTALTLSSTKPTRTGYTFGTWNTAANGSGTSYASGGTVAASMNTAMILYAQWTANTYTVSFNANGGTNAPASINKTYGQSATLPTDKPTRIGHTFMGWALSASAETAQWLAGSNFSEAITADTTLYAVWRDDYESPSITTLRAYRCGFELTQDIAIDPDKTYYERSGSGTSEDPYIYTEVEEPDVSEISTYYELIDDDEAGYARVEATWSIDTSVDEGVVNSATMTGTITPEGQPAQAITFQSGYQGTSGNAVALIDGLDVDTQYTVTVTVTDIKGASAATSRTVLLLRAFYIFDFGSQGNAVGIGRAAPQSGMEVGYPATFDDTVNLYDELQFNGEQAYPTFTRSSWDETSDQTTLPVIPCFVLDTSTNAMYWCDETTITRINPQNFLPLSGGTITGQLNLESSNFDRDAAAPSSDQWGNSYVRLVDKDGEIVGQFRAINRASGIMSCCIGVFGEDTSGTEVSNTIELQVAKDGKQSYYITNPEAFRDAVDAALKNYNASGTNAAYIRTSDSDANRLHIGFDMTNERVIVDAYEGGAWKGRLPVAYWNGAANRVLATPNGSAGITSFRALVPADCSWLGYMESTTISSAKSIANSTWTLLGEVTLAAGRWVLTGNCQFASNSTGRRYICVKESAAAPTAAEQRYYSVSTTAINGAATNMAKAVARTATANQKFGLWVWQNSGDALNCYGYIQAIRIS